MSHVAERQPTRRLSMADRQPPSDLNAEMALLGSAVLMIECLDEIAPILRPDDFYDDANRIIYKHLHTLHESGRKFDDVLLTNSLRASGEYEAAGGGAYLSKIVNYVPSAAHATYYAEIVRDHATRRAMIVAATNILSDSYDALDSTADLVSRSESAVFSVGDKCQALSGAVEINASVLLALDGIEKRAAGQSLRGVSTGFHGLDNLTGGLQPGEVTILAGRTSMGKTAMALNIVRNVSEQQRVILFSMEMDSLSMSERLLAMVAKCDLYRMRSGTIGAEGRQELIEAAEVIHDLKIRIDDTSGRTVSQIASICRRQARREGVGLIVIDYLQLLEPDNHREQRHEQVAKISRRIKGLARELKIPMLVLAQLNRQTTAARDNRPALSHLRESGAIEQDADVVVFCHRPAYYSGERPAGPDRTETAELIVAKNRQGPTGKVDVLWSGAWTSYLNKAAERFASDNKATRVTAFDEYNEAQVQKEF